MPYGSISALPSNIRNPLPIGAQRIWLKAFNASLKKYGEKRARKIAWGAVKNAGYKKSKGRKWKKSSKKKKTKRKR